MRFAVVAGLAKGAVSDSTDQVMTAEEVAELATSKATAAFLAGRGQHL